MEAPASPQIYQFRVWLREISPAIWRRILVRSDSTIADLHETLQIVMGWTDFHLHQFLIRGQAYGIPRLYGPLFKDNPRILRLADFRFLRGERFVYEYDFGDFWQLELRLEKMLPIDPRQTYPRCLDGARATPEEDCGGPWAYMELVEQHGLNPPWEEMELIAKVTNRILNSSEDEAIRDLIGDPDDLQEAVDRLEAYDQFQPEHFDRRAVNSRLKLLAAKGEPPRQEKTEDH